MCDPVALFGGAQALNFMGGRISVKAANKYNQAVAEEQQAAIRENLVINQAVLGRQSTEERQSIATRLEGLRRQAREAEGTAIASAGASGASGNSLGALADLYERNLLESETNALRSLENSDAQRALEQLGLTAQAKAGVVSAIPQKVQGPGFIDLVSAGLDVAAFAVNQNSKDNP